MYNRRYKRSVWLAAGLLTLAASGGVRAQAPYGRGYELPADPPDVGQFVEVLSGDGAVRNRLGAADALGRMGDTAAVPALARAAAFDPDRAVRIAAGDAIAAIRGRVRDDWARPPAQPNRFRQVREIYEPCLQRPMTPEEVQTVRQALQTGTPVVDLQAAVLASDEYFGRTGSRPRLWVNSMYNDVLGRPADPRAMSVVLGWIQTGGREHAAREFIRGAQNEMAARREQAATR